MERRFFLNRAVFFSAALCSGIPLLGDRGERGHPRKLRGTVRYYEPGKRIGIDIKPQVEKIYDLTKKDWTYVMDQDVQIGSSVAIEEKKDENGKKLVSVRVRK